GKVRDAVAAELDVAEEQQVHARHILLSRDEFETAQDVLERALAGEDFTALAAEFSADASNSKTGGELGWFPRGQMVAAFENAVFSAETGIIPELVATQFGLHVVEILEKGVRALPEPVLEQRRQLAFDQWLSERRTEESIEILDWWEALAPAEPTLQDFYARLRAEQGAN
ncbi:MAG TPA: peptidylprolyl isomerase, partial [Anaerolineales bacterium]|nr:peptidylprolyl isomerase [Anaerolineales bacterium]